MSAAWTPLPVTVTDGLRYVDAWHDHHEAPPSALVAVAVSAPGEETPACVALLGRPVARALDADPRTVELTRGATPGGRHGAASACLRVAEAVALAMGFRRVVSYTLLGERGTSYRKAGWRVTGIVRGRQWGCASRPRDAAAQPGDKVRWETGPGARPRDRAAWALLWQSAGKVEIPVRRGRQAQQLALAGVACAPCCEALREVGAAPAGQEPDRETRPGASRCP